MSEATPRVTVIVTAFRRPALLRRLLEALPRAGESVKRIIIVDNGNDPETKQAVDESSVPALYLWPGSNLGCGGGLRLAMEAGLKDGSTTHFLILDDDSRTEPGSVDELLRVMNAENADAAVPMVLNAQGEFTWFPGLLEARAWQLVKRGPLPPAKYIEHCGTQPVRFSWAPWAALMVSVRAVREVGFPRTDYWFYSEDLEFSLRLTHRFNGVLVPTAHCSHLPPEKPQSQREAYLRFALMLQNSSYTFIRLPHGHRALRHLPGNFLRFFRLFGVNARSVGDALRAFWFGAVRGKTAGTPGYEYFWQQLEEERKRG